LYDLSFAQGLIAKFGFLLEAHLRQRVPPTRHDNFLCYYGNSDGIQRLLDTKNILVGYAYLIDRHGFIRWKAHATPTHKEIQSLLNLTRKLSFGTD
jgi:hypothetical protein